MGWAGPTKLGRTQPQKSLGRTRPRPPDWARSLWPVPHSSGPNTIWPREIKKKHGGGELFSPPPPACRTILHAGGKTDAG